MFLVPTYLAESRIHGMGAFASEPIEEGQIVWEFTEGVDWRIPPEVMERFPEPYQGRLREWSYLDESGVYILCGDNAKFMNHADRPNCIEGARFTRAARAIRVGEELTCDYRTFDVEAARHGLQGYNAGEQAGAVEAEIVEGP